jgi:lipoprotein-releasing system permease protein
VLKYASEFREYREVMEKVEKDPDVIGVSPFVINPMMVTHNDRTATGVLLKGVDPERMQKVLDLPRHIVEGTLEGLRRPGAVPPERKKSATFVIEEPPLPGAAQPDSAPASSGDNKGVDVLDAVERAIAEADAKQAAGASTNSAKSAEGAADKQNEPAPSVQPGVDAHAPVGSIEPVGGFQSQLPDDDRLEGVVSDPCRNPAAGELPGIVIGSTLKKSLRVELGDCVQVTSPTIGYSYTRGEVRPPVAKQFRVQGVFQAGFDQYDSKLMYADLYEAQAFYGAGDTVTGVEMRIKDIDKSAIVTQRLDALLDNGIYHTMDWEELNHGLFTALRIQQILMSLVLALIILVAAFTVIATLIMVVLDKKREIAVLKAMGATDGSLMASFLYQGMIIGVLGTGVGLGLGYGLCRWIVDYGFPLDPKVYFISKLPVILRPWDFVWTGVFAVLVCLAACVWPAMNAARLRPAEAFREQ